MGVDLTFEAGRLAERRGWRSAEVVEPAALDSVGPGSGQVIVTASEVGLTVSEARAVAALAASGKQVAVVADTALNGDVVAWLPEGSLYQVGQTQRTGWAVSEGLVTLTPEGGDFWELWDEMVLEEGPSITDAATLADALRLVRVGVAWDRPIFVPSTRLCESGILNIAGSQTPIQGLRAEEYLRFRFEEADLVTAMWSKDQNPLNFSSGDGSTINAVLTLNVSLDGVPVLLVCGPFFESQGQEDLSGCVVREREWSLHWFRVTPEYRFQFARLQGRPGTWPEDLESLPPWLTSLPSDSQHVVLRLFDSWASAFFRALMDWGIDGLCRHGKALDTALQVDWEMLIRRLDKIATEKSE